MAADPVTEYTTPYAYVANDPVNFFDPNGMYRNFKRDEDEEGEDTGSIRSGMATSKENWITRGGLVSHSTSYFSGGQYVATDWYDVGSVDGEIVSVNYRETTWEYIPGRTESTFNPRYDVGQETYGYVPGTDSNCRDIDSQGKTNRLDSPNKNIGIDNDPPDGKPKWDGSGGVKVYDKIDLKIYFDRNGNPSYVVTNGYIMSFEDYIYRNNSNFIVGFWKAFGAFVKNYNDMREANTIGADKYFHCKANFEATTYGIGGEFFAEHFSNLREIWDQYLKGYPTEDSYRDQEANSYGRSQADSIPDGCEACEKFRPIKLDPDY